MLVTPIHIPYKNKNIFEKPKKIKMAAESKMATQKNNFSLNICKSDYFFYFFLYTLAKNTTFI
jgi:hypothetical protein